MYKIAQPLPVPETIEFTGITINISKGAQAIIQNDIKTLLSNTVYLYAKLDRISLYFPIVETMWWLPREFPMISSMCAFKNLDFYPMRFQNLMPLVLAIQKRNCP